MSAMVRYSPRANGRGFSMGIGSARGATSGNSEDLWRQSYGGFRTGEFDPKSHVNAEVAYGLDAWRGILTPYTGVTITSGAGLWRAGARWSLKSPIEISLEASVSEPDGDAKPNNGVFLRVRYPSLTLGHTSVD